MAGMLKIGEVAKVAGLKVETVRFYEAEGLVGEAQRNGGNYRLYDQHQAKRLTFIRRARDLGFTLDQVRDLLRLADDPRGSCSEVDVIAEAHIAEIDRKLADLQAMRGELVTQLSCCDRTTIAECQVIQALRPSPVRGNRREM